MHNPFGEALKRARELRHWSQSEVAEALGISLSTVSRWERGLISPSFYHRRKLSHLFQMGGTLLSPEPPLSVPKARGSKQQQSALIVDIRLENGDACSATWSFVLPLELKGEVAR